MGAGAPCRRPHGGIAEDGAATLAMHVGLRPLVDTSLWPLAHVSTSAAPGREGGLPDVRVRGAEDRRHRRSTRTRGAVEKGGTKAPASTISIQRDKQVVFMRGSGGGRIGARWGRDGCTGGGTEGPGRPPGREGPDAAAEGGGGQPALREADPLGGGEGPGEGPGLRVEALQQLRRRHLQHHRRPRRTIRRLAGQYPIRQPGAVAGGVGDDEFQCMVRWMEMGSFCAHWGEVADGGGTGRRGTRRSTTMENPSYA